MTKLKSFFFFNLLLIFSIGVNAQPIEMRKDWFFGRKASIHFDAQNNISFAQKNPHSVYKRMSSAYLKDGTFAFKTGGNGIYDKDNLLIASLNLGSPSDVKVINHSNNDSLFNILTLTGGQLHHSVFNFYNKSIEQGATWLESNLGHSFEMIKHCFAQGFWIIVPSRNKVWKSFYLQGSSIQIGKESPMPYIHSGLIYDITSSFKGDKVAACHYGRDGFAVMYDFDSRCGLLSNAQKLPQSTTQIPWDFPLGLDFSPNDQFLYVCYSGGLSQLVQYEVNDITKHQVIHATTNDATQFDDILMAPDGKAYLNRHNFGNPSRQVDVIEAPNAQGLGCHYRQNVHQLAETTNGGFQFPPFMNSYTSNFCGRSVREFGDDVLGNHCVGSKLEFITRYADNTFSGVNWVIEYNGTQSFATGKGLLINLTESGILKVTKIKSFCDLKDTLIYEFAIEDKPVYALTKDTTICYGASLDIEVTTNAEKISWSTGDSVASIKVKAGVYNVILSNGLCKAEDKVEVKSYPPLKILLGDNYYICEKENELIKLDAGKGFFNYLWTPTSDTTQWIIVGKVGDYFVVVDDYRGCKGDKGTRVDTRCDLVYFVPNAITPNHDGRNDQFKIVGDGISTAEMQIYNRWGELIYKGDGVTGWNPKNAQEGVYMYMIKVEGFKSKRKVVEYQSGNVTLLK